MRSVRDSDEATLTELSNLQADFRQRLHEHLRLVRRSMASISPQHVQPVDPICPPRLVRRNLICQRRAAGRQQGERQRRGSRGRARVRDDF